MRFGAALLGLALLLGACTPLPQPFRGRAGGDAARLARPLALRLAVPPPGAALLPAAGAELLAERLAIALLAAEVPAVATPTPWPLDWQLQVTAELAAGRVQPRFRLLDADGVSQAAADGTPVAAAAWAEAGPDTLRRVAEQAAPQLAKLLLQVEAARKATDPASLGSGPPRIRLGQVRGAPGDGNTSLPARMRDQLGTQGFVVQDSADGALYAVDATVALFPAPGAKQRVEIVWIVSRRDGEELGRIAQLNELPTGTLDRPWGDIAYVVAEEAAEGVRTVVANATAPAAAPVSPLAGPAVPSVPLPPPTR